MRKITVQIIHDVLFLVEIQEKINEINYNLVIIN